MTSTYRQTQQQCLDAECGHTFGVDIAVTHTICASARPNPTVQLRTSPPRARAQRPANDTGPIAANDTLSVPEVTPRPANDDEATRAAIG